MDASASFGFWLRQRRKALDMTQEDLANRVGCSLSAIRKIEADERRPSRQVAELLAECLDLPIEERLAFVKVARGEWHIERLTGMQNSRLGAGSEQASLPASNLPVPVTPLIGREPELAEMTLLLNNPQCRLLTITGPGGIGKTRLALQAAIQIKAQPQLMFPDGIFFVSLAPVRSAEFIIPAIAEAIRFPFYGSKDLETQLLTYLRDKTYLLVLDNLEQLLDGVLVLSHLLQQAPAVKLLVTSRERLNLHGEWIFEIHGLPVPPSKQCTGLASYSAVALFTHSACRVQPGFNLTERDWPYVVRICQLMDGLPLGIELAATWARLLSCREIAEEIERSFDFLAASVRDLPERHRSLRAAFDHSWDLLSEGEQQALRRLAVFRGGFRREAAEQVAGASLPQLSALVDKSMLHRVAPGRYDMHEMVQQFAEEHLQKSEEAEENRSRHLQTFLALAERAEPELWGPQQVTWLDRLGEEYNNLRAALEWSQADARLAEAGLRLAGALWRFWSVRGYIREGREWMERVLDNPGAASARARAKALNGAGVLAWRQGDYDAASSRVGQCVAICQQQNDQDGLAYALALMGLLKAREGDLQAAHDLTEQSVAFFRQQGDRVGLALSLNSLGELARSQGNDLQASEYYHESLAIYQELGNKRGMADLLHNLGYVAYHQKDYRQAMHLFRKSLEQEQVQRNQRGIAECLIGLAGVMSDQGRPRRAAQLCSVAAALLESIGAVLEPTDQTEYERILAMTHSRLSEQELESAWAAGQSLPLEQAIAYALEEPAPEGQVSF